LHFSKHAVVPLFCIERARNTAVSAGLIVGRHDRFQAAPFPHRRFAGDSGNEACQKTRLVNPHRQILRQNDSAIAIARPSNGHPSIDPPVLRPDIVAGASRHTKTAVSEMKRPWQMDFQYPQCCAPHWAGRSAPGKAGGM
jgi:hypothetical protein